MAIPKEKIALGGRYNRSNQQNETDSKSKRIQAKGFVCLSLIPYRAWSALDAGNHKRVQKPKPRPIPPPMAAPGGPKNIPPAAAPVPVHKTTRATLPDVDSHGEQYISFMHCDSAGPIGRRLVSLYCVSLYVVSPTWYVVCLTNAILNSYLYGSWKRKHNLNARVICKLLSIYLEFFLKLKYLVLTSKNITWRIEKRKVKELQVYYKNARQLSEAQAIQLRISLDKFGLIDRPCINQNGTIIGGHQRLAVLHKGPEEEIEVMVPSRLLDNAEVEELNIRLNKNTGDWDFDILANEWEITDLIKWGFDPQELGISDIAGSEKEENTEQECEKCPTCNQKLKK